MLSVDFKGKSQVDSDLIFVCISDKLERNRLAGQEPFEQGRTNNVGHVWMDGILIFYFFGI